MRRDEEVKIFKIKQVLKSVIPKTIWRCLSQFKSSLNEKYDAWCCGVTIKHVCGPKKVKYGKNEVVVTCLVRNGSAYIKSFIEYYFALGAKHIFFLDNGSDDNTVSLVRKYKDVTVLSSNISLGRDRETDLNKEYILKQYLVNRFCGDRWCINVDIDEFFDYPFSNVISLDTLLDYLNANSYTSVVSQLLDMFSDKPLNEAGKPEKALVRSEHKYYDISSVLKQDYFALGRLVEGNILSNRKIQFYKGGIRKTIFGTNDWLTKHSLIFVKRVKVSAHCAGKVRCADFTAVCFHYKFIDNYYAVVEKYLRNGYGSTSNYAAVASECKKNPQLALKRETAKELNSVNDLIENEFLVISEDYLKFIDEHKKRI